MPHIRFRGVPAQLIQETCEALATDLSRVVGCPEDWFTFEHVPTTFYFGGAEVQGPAIVEVLWFDRGVACQDEVAALLTAAVAPVEAEDTSVIFFPLEKHHYYENGECLG